MFRCWLHCFSLKRSLKVDRNTRTCLSAYSFKETSDQYKEGILGRVVKPWRIYCFSSVRWLFGSTCSISSTRVMIKIRTRMHVSDNSTLYIAQLQDTLVCTHQYCTIHHGKLMVRYTVLFTWSRSIVNSSGFSVNYWSGNNSGINKLINPFYDSETNGDCDVIISLHMQVCHGS